MPDDVNRAELASFLRSRRNALDRSQLGLAPLPRARGIGLRREEVAALSGVSVTWYTWLEQARPASNASRQVLDALAAALRLSTAEHDYLLSLAGYTRTSMATSAREQRTNQQHLLDALPGAPAFTLTPSWNISAWNKAYEALYPHVATMPDDERNLLWAVFTDPFVRELLPDWESTSQHFLAEFRAEAVARLAQPAFQDLIERLQQVSDEFRQGWQQHPIAGFTSRRRDFQTHAGQLSFHQHRLAPDDERDIHLVIYTPLDTLTTRRLRRLSMAK